MSDANARPAKNSAPPPFLPPNGRIWIYLAGLCLVGAVAISRQSLWIDEGFTALKAQQPTLQGWWRAMLQFSGSDLQMPLYMFWIWICGRIFGTSELALRAVNLFWFAPGLLALLRVFAGRPRMQLALFLTAVLNPFAWYYLNEARPYAMQLGASLFLAAALCHWRQKGPASANESGWVWGFVMALVALSGASLLGMIWAALPLAAAFVLLPKNQLLTLGRRHVFVWLTGLAVLSALGIYYLWTLKSGARASSIAASNWKNILFALYELFGFSGLGPGRLAIRTDESIRVFVPYLPQLALYAAVIFVLLAFAIHRLWQMEWRKTIFGLLLLAAAPAVFIVSAGMVLHFRVLGRHFAPLFPLIVLLPALGITAAWRRGWGGKMIVILFFSLSLISCLALRFGASHAKEDYRSAAAVAEASLARGERVWWNASDGAAIYYHVPLTTNSDAVKQAYLIQNPTRESVPDVNQADVIVTSRPDTFDVHGALTDQIARNHFKIAEVFPAFVIWEKPSPRTK
jgi:hypothetical protein